MHPNKKLIIFFTLLSLFISAGHFLNLRLKPPAQDGMHYTAYAYNTLKHGVYSHNRSEKPKSNNRREPMYPITLMIGIMLHPGIDLSVHNAKCIAQGKNNCIELVTYLKIINIIFLMLCALISAYFVYRYTSKKWVSVICFLLISLSGQLGRFTGRFYTEILAALLLVALSFLLYELVEKGFTKRRAFTAGLSLGALALTKAVYLYFLYLSCILLFILWLYQKKGIKKTINEVSIFFLGAFILLAPWFAHNYFKVGTLSMVGGRSGVNLLARASMNNMTDEEYRANILLSLPNFSFVKKTRKKYINPELKKKIKETRYYDLAYSEQDRIKKMTGLRGVELNDYVVNIGMKRILKNFKKHLTLVPLVSLRGIVNTEHVYGFDRLKNDLTFNTISQKNYNIDISKVHFPGSKMINFLTYIISFGIFILCLLFRKWGLFWFLLPFAFCFAMYAFLTPFANRFSYHFIPILIVATMIFVSKMFLLLKQRFMNQYHKGLNV